MDDRVGRLAPLSAKLFNTEKRFEQAEQNLTVLRPGWTKCKVNIAGEKPTQTTCSTEGSTLMLSGSWVRAEFAPKSPTDAQREQGRRGCICWEKQRHELSGAAKYRPAVLPQLNLSPAHRGCRRTKKAPKAVRGHRGLWSAVGVENGDFSGLKKNTCTQIVQRETA